MNCFSKLFSLLILISFSSCEVTAQECSTHFNSFQNHTYAIPTPLGKTTASAFLREYKLNATDIISHCTILIKDSVIFEIDVPLSFFQVTVIASSDSEIRVKENQILRINECSLLPEKDNYWNGITLESQTAQLWMDKSEVSNAINGIQIKLAKNE